MRALLTDHSVPGGLRLGTAADPRPGPHQALVKVAATSLNHGEVAISAGTADQGIVLGWDAAGVVVQAAADGTGPEVGTRVVTLGADGGWAEMRAVDTRYLGVVPPDADLGAISTIPVAAGTALVALRRVGPLLGRRVLITGATGGVGRYAVQLARLAGADVVAVTGDPAKHGAGLRELGAGQVIADPGDLTVPVDAVLDQIGGAQLVSAFGKLAAGGTLVSIGHAAHEPEVFEFGAMFGEHGHDRSIATFFLLECGDLSAELTWLAGKVADGTLDPQIAWRGDWTDVAEATGRLLGRELHGKAVLTIG